LELALPGGFVRRRRHGSASAPARRRRWTLRIYLQGPPAGTAVGDADSRVGSPLRSTLCGHLLFTQIPAQWLAAVWTERTAGPAIVGLG
jgi:hypothetical protein